MAPATRRRPTKAALAAAAKEKESEAAVAPDTTVAPATSIDECSPEESVVNEVVSKPTTEPSIEEPIVLQLSITADRMDELIAGEDIRTILKYNPNITEPEPYAPENHFTSENVQIESTTEPTKVQGVMQAASSCRKKVESKTHHEIVCFWCCHHIVDTEYGMPVRYDSFHSNFTMFGSFCSLECAAAYNYSTNMGCDRVWEVHSWIQLLGKKYGFEGPIRPAPSRYLLRMFNGPMEIEEFRQAHKGLAKTHVMNIPPFIHISSQMESINTSFFGGKEASSAAKSGCSITNEIKAVKSRAKTLGQKMNLAFSEST